MTMSDADIDAALTRRASKRDFEPRAVSARYDAKSDCVVIDLSNASTFTVPPRLIEGLADARNDQLTNVELLGEGYGLHWPGLDVDITVKGLLAGIFGTRAHMARLTGQAE